MKKRKETIVICLVAGILLSTSLSMVDAESNIFKMGDLFSPVFTECFFSYPLNSALASLDVKEDGDTDYIFGLNYNILICENKGVFGHIEEPICALDHDFYFDDIHFGGLSSGDMNYDGFADIVVGGVFGKIRVVQNNGGGDFSEHLILDNFGENIYGINTVDWNQDGLNDIVFSCSSNYTGYPVSVILNQGSNHYSEPIYLFETDELVVDLDVNDFDNDGDWDVLVSYSSSGADSCFVYEYISLFRNNGEDLFGQIPILERGDGEYHNGDTRIHARLATADYDQDGDIDFAFGDNSGIVELLINEGDGSFEERGILCDLGNVSMPIPSDYDQDGDVDIVVSTMGFEFGIDGGFYVIYNNIIPLSLHTPQPNHLYLFGHQLYFSESSTLIGPTTFRINRQVETDYVEFYANDKLMHTDSSYPFEWRWGKLHFGEANVEIIGYFADGTTYTLQEHYTKIF